jgi:predicted permease
MSPLRRLWNVLRRSRLDDDLRQELDTHLALIEEEERRQGLTAEQARQNARARFGNPLAYRERALDEVITTWFEDACTDARFAVRVLVRAPGFSAAGLLTIALGIGANAAIFSVVSGVILRPLPYPRSEQLMYVSTQYPVLNLEQVPLSAPEYLELREVNHSFAVIGAFITRESNITAGDRALRVRSANVDEQLLEALGIQPDQGRLFARGETYRIGAPEPPLLLPPVLPLVILSHELWQTAFGGRPIIGQTIEVDKRPREVIGIMPPGADLMDNQTEIWLPLGLIPANPGDRLNHFLRVIGRLRNGTTEEAAHAELKALNASWGDRVGVTGHMFAPMPSMDASSGTRNPSAGHLLQMTPLQDQVVGAANRPIWMLQVAAGFVLLMACVNLANLLLARAETRHREVAVRVALGANRGRLLRQFITEGALLSIAGGALALWMAHVGLQALTQSYPAALPRAAEISVGLPVLLFTCGVAAVISIFFGLAQLRHMGAKGLATVLVSPGTRGAAGAMRHRARRGLVVAELALAIVLVLGAGLLLRTVYNLTRIDAGFNPSRLLTFSIALPIFNFPQPEARVQWYQSLLDALRGIPGVEAATAMNGLPPNRPPIKNNTRVANAQVSSGEPFETVDYYQYVMADYFETIGIPIVRGRSFQPSDATSSGMVAVVNEAFVDRFWKGLDPIGQRIKPCCNDQPPWFSVIGVAKDVKQAGVDQEAGTEVYFFVEQTAKLPPALATAPAALNVVLRTSLPPTALFQTIERVVRERERSVPVVRFRAMDAVFTESIQRPRLLAQLLGLFGGLALLLAAVGTYGVFSYIVAARRGEIGIRMALGAHRLGVLTHVMKEGLLLAGVAVVVGLAGAFALSRLIVSLLFGVRPTDVPTAAGVAGTVFVVAAVACLMPAWRASRLDPSAVLRSD